MCISCPECHFWGVICFFLLYLSLSYFFSSPVLQKKLENGSCIPDDANAADVCSLFKQFFHTLPEPLITPKLQSAFYKCSQIEDIAEQRWVVLNICHLLPSLNLQTLRFIVLFLHCVASRSEKNRMDVSNLAKVFTPNFFGTFTALDKKNPEKMIGLQTSMVSLMIENARLIGEVPEWMIEKIAGHNQSREYLDRLTSEDELEKSDDNLEECGRLSRRRRRKSGTSFQGTSYLFYTVETNAIVHYAQLQFTLLGYLQLCVIATCFSDEQKSFL